MGEVLSFCPWSCCSHEAVSLADFCLWSFSGSFQNAHLWSRIQSGNGLLSCIQPLILGDDPFTKRAAEEGWVNSFIVWNPTSHRERPFKWAWKPATDLSLFCLHVCIIYQSAWAGKTLGMAYKMFSCYSASPFWSRISSSSLLGFCHLASCIHLGFPRTCQKCTRC